MLLSWNGPWASSDASQLAGAPERRLARDEHLYTRREFLVWYGDAGERAWAEAGLDRLAGSDAPQLADGRTDGVTEPDRTVVGQPDQTPDAAVSSASDWLPANTIARDAAQLPAGSADALAVTARLMPEHLLAIRQREAARGPPRSLHKLARDALDAISNSPTQHTVDLDGYFPWVQYVAAHTHSAAIIGPGITRARAVFLPGTNDPNRGGAPRLDFCFYRTDGTVCRVHPGGKPKNDAKLVFDRS